MSDRKQEWEIGRTEKDHGTVAIPLIAKRAMNGAQWIVVALATLIMTDTKQEWEIGRTEKDHGTVAIPLIAKRAMNGAQWFLVAMAALMLMAGCAPPRADHPVIGAKNFTEQVVLGELPAQEIEAKSNLKVERRFYRAGSYICQQARVAGRIGA